MKHNLLLIIAVAFLALNFSCSNDDDDNKNSIDTLPGTARALIEARFSEYNILEITTNPSPGYDHYAKYVVRFSDNLTITFSELGFWMIIDSPNGFAEDAWDIIGGNKYNQIKEAFPNAKAIKFEMRGYGHGITLDNGKILALGFEDHFGEDITHLTSEVPSKLKSFITAYYPDEPLNYIVKMSEHYPNQSYKLGFQNGTYILFNKDIEWDRVSGGSEAVSPALKNSLPAIVKDCLTERYGNAVKISNIIKCTNYYSLAISIQGGSSNWLLIDLERGNVEPPVEKVKDFVKAYISDEEINSISTNLVNDPDKIRFSFPINVGSYSIFLFTDLDGNWYDLIMNKALPSKIMALLPEKAVEYINKNYSDAEARRMAKDDVNGVYSVFFNREQLVLHFDKEGNLLSI